MTLPKIGPITATVTAWRGDMTEVACPSYNARSRAARAQPDPARTGLSRFS